ncbi:MAG: SH3 domain-containing protein [Christensenellaceae bacterium]|jgi:uncharacterized protein YraI|nr:SH3 domain-containing protein [Christensenellaceae bacterium]
MKLRQYLAVLLVVLFLTVGASTACAAAYSYSDSELDEYRLIILNEALAKYNDRIIVGVDGSSQALLVLTTQEDKESVSAALKSYGIDMSRVCVETMPLDNSIAKATANVNVRSGPGTTYKRLGKLQKSQSISVVKVANEWAQIVWQDSVIAYVHVDYLSFYNEIAIVGNDTSSMATATANVNIRAGRGTGYRKLGKLKKGQQVIVKGVLGDWAQIEVSTGDPAYVHTKYLRGTDDRDPSLAPFTKDERAWYERYIREALDLGGFAGKYTLTLNSDKSIYIVSVQNSLQESVYNKLEGYGIAMIRVRVQGR